MINTKLPRPNVAVGYMVTHFIVTPGSTIPHHSSFMPSPLFFLKIPSMAEAPGSSTLPEKQMHHVLRTSVAPSSGGRPPSCHIGGSWSWAACGAATSPPGLRARNKCVDLHGFMSRCTASPDEDVHGFISHLSGLPKTHTPARLHRRVSVCVVTRSTWERHRWLARVPSSTKPPSCRPKSVLSCGWGRSEAGGLLGRAGGLGGETSQSRPFTGT